MGCALPARLRSERSVLGEESIINIRVFLEHFLVTFRAEIKGFAFIVGADRAVSVPEADRAQRMRATRCFGPFLEQWTSALEVFPPSAGIERLRDPAPLHHIRFEVRNDLPHVDPPRRLDF